MQKISPHLWFDTQAKDAAAFYTALFDDSRIVSSVTLKDTPSGDADFLTIQLMGQDFSLISAGPYFKLNPSVSFLVACKTKEEVTRLWTAFSEGGKALMELGAYPFSEYYGWVQDAFGVSWQVMFMGDREITQTIIPTTMFVGEQCGKAEEAMNFYTSIFKNSRIDNVMRYEAGEGTDQAGTIKYASFTLEGQSFATMDSAGPHEFAFNEAVSYMVRCETQEELDYYWNKLSAVPEAEQCGWLKDKYGFSWQIVPSALNEMMTDKDEKRVARVTQAFLKMKKFDLATLKEAYEHA